MGLLVVGRAARPLVQVSEVRANRHAVMSKKVVPVVLCGVSSDGKSRAAVYRRRQLSQGLVQVSVWLPVGVAPELSVIASRLCSDVELAFGPLRHVPTGQLRKV